MSSTFRWACTPALSSLLSPWAWETFAHCAKQRQEATYAMSRSWTGCPCTLARTWTLPATSWRCAENCGLPLLAWAAQHLLSRHAAPQEARESGAGVESLDLSVLTGGLAALQAGAAPHSRKCAASVAGQHLRLVPWRQGRCLLPPCPITPTYQVRTATGMPERPGSMQGYTPLAHALKGF